MLIQFSGGCTYTDKKAMKFWIWEVQRLTDRWLLYTGHLNGKSKAQLFWKLFSDHDIQGDSYIQGRCTLFWL